MRTHGTSLMGPLLFCHHSLLLIPTLRMKHAPFNSGPSCQHPSGSNQEEANYPHPTGLAPGYLPPQGSYSHLSTGRRFYQRDRGPPQIASKMGAAHHPLWGFNVCVCPQKVSVTSLLLAESRWIIFTCAPQTYRGGSGMSILSI